jgi:pimeloyl-ACP methyl ester carboxylesterase
VTAAFRERRFSAQDGLALYFRDYGDASLRATPVLCLAGIGRNSKDFHGVASRLSTSRRVLAMDYRGRGRSAYDPNWQNYQPRTYVNDALHLMAVAGIEKAILLGTSLGAILAMLLTSIQPGALAGVILNDMGPEMPADGFKRIRGYIGKIPRQRDRVAAVAALQGMFGPAFPDFTDADWQTAVDNMFRREADGSYVLDYDPAIAKPLAAQSDEPPKLWRFFKALGPIPTLALRGALSDVLSEATFAAMAEAKPDLMQATIPNRGHSPTLDEPASRAAIDRFLAGFAARGR